MVKLIVGLGNTGAEYAQTRHNVGLIALKRLNLQWKTKVTLGGHIAQPNPNLVVFWPETFMNICGKQVKMCLKLSKIDKTDIVVIHDCLETKLGKVKLIQGTSFKGHNGLKSISQELGGYKDFQRIAIGIGRPEERDPEIVARFVLSKFSGEEMEVFDEQKTFAEVKELIDKF